MRLARRIEHSVMSCRPRGKGIPSATPSQQRLEKLRADANSCALMSESEIDGARRELFRRLAEQLALEAP
jgi:hypothetical protein